MAWKKPNVFLTFLEFGKKKMKCLMRACFLFHRWASFHYVLTWQKGRQRGSKLSAISLLGTLTQSWTAPLSWSHLNLITSQRSNLQIPSHWELGLQYMNFGTLLSEHSVSSPLKFMFFSQEKCIPSIWTSVKVLIHFSINSKVQNLI